MTNPLFISADPETQRLRESHVPARLTDEALSAKIMSEVGGTVPDGIIQSDVFTRIVATTDPNRLPLPGELVIEYQPPFTASEDFTDGIDDWSSAWVNSTLWEVADDATALDGKAARIVPTNTYRYALRWDTVGLGEDVEILVRSKYTGTTNNAAGVILRGSGGSGTETGYASMLYRGGYAMAKFVAGVYTSLGSSTTHGLTTGEWAWTRFRVQGDQISTKVWADGTVEPLDWSTTRSDASIDAPGFIGLVSTEGDARWDIVSIAFDGARAELP